MPNKFWEQQMHHFLCGLAVTSTGRGDKSGTQRRPGGALLARRNTAEPKLWAVPTIILIPRFNPASATAPHSRRATLWLH
jgi:hypothetical protein